jgi:hypothetical protein
VPLSDDQRALLRLLAQREEGYEDIAALMGLSVVEVRSRVKGALSALDESGEAPSDAGGQRSADRAPAPVPPAERPMAEEAPKEAEGRRSAARATAPPAEAPQPARAGGAGADREASVSPPPVPRRASTASRGPRLALPRDRRRAIELLGGALVALLIVLFATGALDIGGDDGSDGSDSAALQGGALDTANGKLTQAALQPVGGGDAEGQALFGRLGKQVVLQVLAEGLEPSTSGESYAIWLYRSPKLALRIGAVDVGENGKLGARFPVPTELLALVASGSFKQIQVSRTANAAYKAEVAAAKRAQRLPRYTGETVLSGEIVGPLVKAAG